jgi:flavin reductase (DIM6/NTAB) family NADH-FMN oxidoreductase RutF
MNEDARKALLRAIPHGLYIVTTGAGDNAHGFTATWLTQASFKPPLVMLAVRRDSFAHAAMSQNKHFAVNYLDKDSRAIAEAFFKPPRAENGKFGIHGFSPAPETGSPVLDAALGWLDCKRIHTFEHGDHSIMVGEVLEASVLKPGEPLVLGDTAWKYGG